MVRCCCSLSRCPFSLDATTDSKASLRIEFETTEDGSTFVGELDVIGSLTVSNITVCHYTSCAVFLINGNNISLAQAYEERDGKKRRFDCSDISEQASSFTAPDNIRYIVARLRAMRNSHEHFQKSVKALKRKYIVKQMSDMSLFVQYKSSGFITLHAHSMYPEVPCGVTVDSVSTGDDMRDADNAQWIQDLLRVVNEKGFRYVEDVVRYMEKYISP